MHCFCVESSLSSRGKRYRRDHPSRRKSTLFCRVSREGSRAVRDLIVDLGTRFLSTKGELNATRGIGPWETHGTLHGLFNLILRLVNCEWRGVWQRKVRCWFFSINRGEVRGYRWSRFVGFLIGYFTCNVIHIFYVCYNFISVLYQKYLLTRCYARSICSTTVYSFRFGETITQNGKSTYVAIEGPRTWVWRSPWSCGSRIQVKMPSWDTIRLSAGKLLLSARHCPTVNN